jgi:BREX protein BrxB
MPSLKDNFNELLERVRRGREPGHASFEPVYYLVFHSRQILEAKRLLPAWIARLSNEGFEVHRFSMAQEIAAILRDAPLRKIWLEGEKKAPLAWDRANQSLANALTNGSLRSRLESVLDGLKGRENAILLVTDLEALHPYLRIGSLETGLHGHFCVPTLFLYPGERTGKTRLKFLGFYPEDGNYRSVHVGG